ncbi:tripartite tricarboxylate transporter permease [Tepidimonas sp.]|uniref:tripartite tricarboxylate transporter permease n=1 Tax=Tepidimonas sp. TaxID=2002775 RepID=UPI00391EE348
MLAGVYYGAQYGGSTASILLNLPGTPSSAVACLDGYPMSKQGRAGVALFMTTIASFVGSMLGIAILTGFAPVIAEARYDFGIPELMDGINIVALAMGLFGIAEVVSSVNQPREGQINDRITWRSMLPTPADWKASIMPMLRGTGIGSFCSTFTWWRSSGCWAMRWPCCASRRRR